MNAQILFPVPEPIVLTNCFELTIQYFLDQCLTKSPLFNKLQNAIYHTKCIDKHLVAVAWLDGAYCFFINDSPFNYSQLKSSDITRARLMAENKIEPFPYLWLNCKDD